MAKWLVTFLVEAETRNQAVERARNTTDDPHQVENMDDLAAEMLDDTKDLPLGRG